MIKVITEGMQKRAAFSIRIKCGHCGGKSIELVKEAQERMVNTLEVSCEACGKVLSAEFTLHEATYEELEQPDFVPVKKKLEALKGKGIEVEFIVLPKRYQAWHSIYSNHVDYIELEGDGTPIILQDDDREMEGIEIELKPVGL